MSRDKRPRPDPRRFMIAATCMLSMGCAWAPAYARSTRTPSASCRIADILSGKIRLDIISRSDYETAIIRSIEFRGGRHSSTVPDPQRAYGRILGEITAERGAFSVVDIDRVIVGQISPELVIEGWDKVCGDSRMVIRPAIQEGGYVILNGENPVGTIEGRFPKNRFGVR
ncbi:MAG: hypothetical protein ACJ8DO_00535 [Microvirga sp.]